MERTEAGSCVLVVGQLLGIGVLLAIGIYAYDGVLNWLQGSDNILASILHFILVLPKTLLILGASNPGWSVPIWFLIILVFFYINATKQGATAKPGFFITLFIVIGYLIYRFFAL